MGSTTSVEDDLQADFKRTAFTQIMPTIYDKVVGLISRDSEERTMFECQELVSWFRKKSKLFKDVKPGKKE